MVDSHARVTSGDRLAHGASTTTRGAPRSHDGAGDGSSRPSRRLLGALVELPDRLTVWFVWAALVVGVTVTLRVFFPVLVVAAIVAVLLVTRRWTPRAYPRDAASVAGSAAALVVAGVWVLVNRHHAAQLLSVAQDPSVYTLRGWWLMHHSSPNLPLGDAVQALRGVPVAVLQTGGFPVVHGMIRPQGNSLVPGLIAVAGWVGGGRALLQGNVALGGLALISLYTFARRLIGPLWALVPMVALSLSLPMLYFSRAPYTEPTALIAVFTGLTMLWSGWRAESRVQVFLGGLFLGVSQIARVDGIVAVIGACVAIALVAVLATDLDLRRRARGYLLTFAVGAALTVALGTLDLQLNSPAYLDSLRPRLKELSVLFVVVVAAGLALSAFPATLRLASACRRNTPRIAKALAIVGAVGLVVMVSRPLWWHPHGIAEGPVRALVAQHQRAEGATVDASRSYDENSITWLAWYLGWPVVVLGGVGFVWLVWDTVRRRDARVAVLLGVLGAVAVLYLNSINITPTQIWAVRRFLPVIIPGLLLTAAWACARLWTWRLRPATDGSPARRDLAWSWAPRVVAVALGLVVVVAPVVSWNKLTGVGEEAGEYNEVMAACHAVHGDRVIVSGGVPASGYYLPTARAVCDKQTIFFPSPNQAFLAQIRRNWGGHDVTLLTFTPTTVPWTRPPTPLYAGTYETWQQPLLRAPSQVVRETRTLYAGRVQPDGSVVPVAPAAR